MELPRYDIAFREDAGVPEFSDVSFRWNAQAIIDSACEYLPSLRAHLRMREHLAPAELVAYNERVARTLYGPRVLELFREHRDAEITALAAVQLQRLLAPNRDVLASIDYANLSLVLVRPEARFLSREIQSFLAECGFRVLFEHRLVVRTHQYWAMYNPGFLASDLNDFPTRTLVYTRGESKVLVLQSDSAGAQEVLNAAYKGRAGVPSATPTLRGTVILDGFERAKGEAPELFYDAVDPLGMYRAITQGAIASPDPYATCEDPVLFYAGQGIHLPESDELAANLGVLLPRHHLCAVRRLARAA